MKTTSDTEERVRATEVVPIWIDTDRPFTRDAVDGLLSEDRTKRGEREDHLVHARRLSLEVDEGMIGLRVEGRRFELHEHALRQLMRRLGTPPGRSGGALDLVEFDDLNRRLKRAKGKALVRVEGDAVRAVLSTRYAPCDDEAVLDALLRGLERCDVLERTRLRAVALGSITQLRLSFGGDDTFEARRGDPIEVGVDVRNSEVGASSVRILPSSYRLVCSNGMMGWVAARAPHHRHVGNADRLIEDVQKQIEVALRRARGQRGEWLAASGRNYPSLARLLEGLASLGLRRRTAHHVRETFGAEGEDAMAMSVNAYDVANALTDAAKAEPTLETRSAVERLAGRMLAPDFVLPVANARRRGIVATG